MADIVLRSHDLQHFVGNILRIGRRKAHPHSGAGFGDHLQKTCEIAILIIVRIDILSQQGHFFIAAGSALACFPDYGMIVPAAFCSARIRHYTVRAYVVASPHDGNKRRHTVAVEAHRLDVGIGLLPREFHIDLGHAETGILYEQREGAVGVGTGHDVHFAGIGQLLFEAFRHAAEYAHKHSRPLALLLPEHLDTAQDALLGVVAHGAGIGHDDVGLGHIFGAFVTVLSKQGEYDFGVSYIHLTTVGLYIYFLLHRFFQPAGSVPRAP